MKINLVTGLIEDIDFIASPNYSARPENTVIDLLVIHGISLPPGEFGGPYIQQLFTNTLDLDAHPAFQSLAGLKVSSHVLIRRDGQVIQFVPFTSAAWHAGESQFQGRPRCNEFSIGIELEGTDTYPYAPDQYQQLAKLTRALMTAYPAITPERIVGHSDIAPGRKTDPGPAFEWAYFFELLN
jgi:AmpD protein